MSLDEFYFNKYLNFNYNHEQNSLIFPKDNNYNFRAI